MSNPPLTPTLKGEIITHKPPFVCYPAGPITFDWDPTSGKYTAQVGGALGAPGLLLLCRACRHSDRAEGGNWAALRASLPGKLQQRRINRLRN